MSDNKKRTELQEMGEFRLIDHLTGSIKLNNKTTVKGVGDDAAVLDPQGKHMVVTTDYLLEGIHFDLVYHPLKHLGYKAVVVNVSDVYAMNAIPHQVTISIGVSKRFCLEDLEEFYEGVNLACKMYGVDLVGGDTTASLTGMVISVTAIGYADKEKICYRSGAKENDLICVTGDLGAAYMGLQLLEREKAVFQSNPGVQPRLEGYDYILERILKPEARKPAVELLAELGVVPTSMIDISDGLSSELLHICKHSEVGCKVFLEKIPIDQETHRMANEMNIDPVVAAFSGGEDYELMFTVPVGLHNKVKEMEGVSIVGHISHKNDGPKLVTPDGKEITITAQGWNAIT